MCELADCSEPSSPIGVSMKLLLPPLESSVTALNAFPLHKSESTLSIVGIDVVQNTQGQFCVVFLLFAGVIVPHVQVQQRGKTRKTL